MREMCLRRGVKTILALVFCLCSYTSAFSAIVADFTASASGFTNTLSWSHTVSGSSRILVVGISTSGTVSTVKYNGVNFSRINTISNGVVISLWYLVAPVTGTNTITVALSGVSIVSGGSESYTGVDQLSPLGVSAGTSGVSNVASVSVTGSTNSVVVDIVGSLNNLPTAGAGQVQQFNRSQTNYYGAGSYKAGSASTVMRWTFSAASIWAIIAVPLNAAAPLPVTLVELKAVCRENQVIISWVTASEVNNEEFVVEKSYDGQVFHVVSVVDGSGNSSSIHRYEVRDLFSEPVYYRLLQRDFNGSESYFPVVMPEPCVQAPGEEFLRCRPEAGHSRITAELNLGTAQVVQYGIYDISGRKVGEGLMGCFPGLNRIYIDTGVLAKGYYLVLVNTREKSLQARFPVQ